MNGATPQSIEAPSAAAIRFAVQRARRSAARNRRASSLAKLPPLCYALVANNAPGHRVVIIKAGDRGHYLTEYDGPTMELAAARILVDRLNVRMGVTDAQQEAMLAGSTFGFHVPAADPEHPIHTAARRVHRRRAEAGASDLTAEDRGFDRAGEDAAAVAPRQLLAKLVAGSGSAMLRA